MYIFNNALRCITRAKGRNVIIGLVVVLLSVSSCIGLSIKEANKTIKKQYANDMEISATLTPKSRDNEITLDKLEEFSKKDTVKSFNKTASLYFSAGDGIEPIDVAGSFKQNKDFKAEFGNVKPGESRTFTSSSESGVSLESNNGKDTKVSLLTNTSENETSGEEIRPEQTPENKENETSDIPETKASESDFSMPDNSNEDKDNDSQSKEDFNNENSFDAPPEMKGGDTFVTQNFFFNMASMNDFTVVGADEDSLPQYIAELNVLDLKSADYKCVISKNLADENELKIGDTFALKNPENEDESYSFTICGIADSSKSGETEDASSNASFTDNSIYVNYKTIEDIVSKSSALNGEATVENREGKMIALSPRYSGTFIFANLTDYNKFSSQVGENYNCISEDVSNYEQSITQLETLGKYATYFLIVIFVIGAFVLVIINLFSIRNRKYEIGVLTAIGMKKYKVGLQFVVELFVVTFVALIIGSSVGAVSSVPVTNKLLQTVNSEQTTDDNAKTDMKQSDDKMTPPSGNEQMTPPNNFGGKMQNFKGMAKSYVAKIDSATNLTVIFEMIGVGIILTIISSIASMMFIMRYEPLKILNNRD